MTSTSVPTVSLSLQHLSKLEALHKSYKLILEMEDLTPGLRKALLELKLPPQIEIFEQELHLYRCSNCGELRLTTECLEGDSLLHACSKTRLRALGKLSSLIDSSDHLLSCPLGRFEHSAKGPLASLIPWSHSLQLGLDNEFKGI